MVKSMESVVKLPFVGEPHEGGPCCVKHPHAGGQCKQPAAVTVYGLNYCREHGGEAKLGALEEARHDAEQFFERYRSPETRALTAVLARALEDASARLFSGGEDGEDYYEVLMRAYANPPAGVRAMVEAAELDDEPGYQPFADSLLGSLNCIHKLMRLAYEDRETWLVEVLEGERQTVAAQAAYAVRDWSRMLEAALEASRKRSGERAG